MSFFDGKTPGLPLMHAVILLLQICKTFFQLLIEVEIPL
jgi:hypothetical protein